MDFPALIPNLLVLIVFVGLDVFWLFSLSGWRISFGPRALPVTMFAVLRGALFVIWIVLQARVIRNAPVQLSFYTFLGTNLLLLGLGIYGFCIEPFQLTQTRIEVSVPGLSRPLRMVQLSDLHIEYTTRREEEVLALLEELKPDLIVMTGDYTSEAYTNDWQTYDDLRKFVSRLHAPYGVYAVNGNAESEYVMGLLFENMNVRLLENQAVRIPGLENEPILLLGLSYIDTLRDEQDLLLLASKAKADDFTILLYHKPDLAYAARDLGVDLYLCGHTHGGQVRLPFIGAIYANSRYGKTFEMGRYTLDQMTLFVSRGLGFTGGSAPRVRFLAPPEVVVIDLVPQK